MSTKGGAIQLAWVTGYYTRTGDMSLAGHLECFDAYAGPKLAVHTQPSLEPPAPELLAWLR